MREHLDFHMFPNICRISHGVCGTGVWQFTAGSQIKIPIEKPPCLSSQVSNSPTSAQALRVNQGVWRLFLHPKDDVCSRRMCSTPGSEFRTTGAAGLSARCPSAGCAGVKCPKHVLRDSHGSWVGMSGCSRVGMAGHWNTLPGAVVTVPSLKELKKCLDSALMHVWDYWGVLCRAGRRNWSLWFPPSSAYSVILCAVYSGESLKLPCQWQCERFLNVGTKKYHSLSILRPLSQWPNLCLNEAKRPL